MSGITFLSQELRPQSQPAIRLLTAIDLPSVIKLSTFAGWNQTMADWKTLLDLDPETCLGVECDGNIVATTTLICYGDKFAWLGMVLTHPEYRKRGFAQSLVESTLRIAESRNILSVKLDATHQGFSLYERVGFRTEQMIQRWSRPATVHTATEDYSSHTIEGLNLDLDSKAFGADRSRVLSLLAEASPCFQLPDAYAMCRPGARAFHLGPCAARSPELAKQVIENCLASHNEQSWYWDLLPSNLHAVRVAESIGFQAERSLVRMFRGPHLRGDDSMIYAAGGFELG